MYVPTFKSLPNKLAYFYPLGRQAVSARWQQAGDPSCEQNATFPSPDRMAYSTPGAVQPGELDSASGATPRASLASTGSEQLSSRRERTLSICPHASPAAVPLQCTHVNVRASGAKELRTRDEEAASSLPGSALPPKPKRISACYGIIAGAVPSPSSELSVPELGRSVAPPEPVPEPEP